MKAQTISHKLSLTMSFLLFIVFIQGIAVADIVTTGETSPVYDSSDPWSITDGLTVGIDSDGTMTISDGSTVNSSTGYIAGFLVGTGGSAITGTSSLWDMSGNLYAGFGGSGNLAISNGGHVSDVNGYAGYKANSSANVEISGSDSLWQNSGDLYLGYSGTADVLVSNGGTITNVDGYIGYHSGIGTVTITGTGSLWGNSGDLYIANRGFAELTISDGAKVSNNNGFIGYYGPPAVLDEGLEYMENRLIVRFAPKMDESYPNTEEMNTILASLGGGTVISESSFTEGFAKVELPDNVFVNPDVLRTYNDSPDILYAESIGYAYIAEWLGLQDGPASVTVTGTGSLWENTGTLYIGGNQTEPRREATLNISDGGTVQADEVVIWNEGILTGDSLLKANTVTNKGTIRPGNSIRTLTIDGDLTMQAGSTLEIEVDNSGDNYKLVVTGDTTIEGGAIQATSTETITSAQEYTILETGSITGTFDSLNTSMLSSVLLSSELGYETDAVKLILSPLNFDDSSIVSSNNQKSVGSALQVIADGGGNSITTGLQQLTNLSEVRNAYDQLSGQTIASLASVTSTGSTQFTGTVSGRLHNTHSGLSFGFNDSLLFAMAQPDSDTSMYDTGSGINSFALGNGTNYFADKKWGIWLRGYGVFGDRETQSESPGYQYRIYGTGFGVDYKFTDELLLGITGGYSDGQVDYFSSRDKSEISGTPIGIYGSWFTEGGYVDSLISYTPMEYETTRYVDLTSEKLKGQFDGSETSAYLEVGRNWFLSNDLLVQPMTSFQYSYLSLDDYTESGGVSALSFDEHCYQSYKGSLGMKAKKQFLNETKDQNLTFELRGRWIHEFGDTKSNINTNFASNPGAIFKISDKGLPRDSAILGIGLKQIKKQNMMYYLDYDISLNREDTSNIISAGFKYLW